MGNKKKVKNVLSSESGQLENKHSHTLTESKNQEKDPIIQVQDRSIYDLEIIG